MRRFASGVVLVLLAALLINAYPSPVIPPVGGRTGGLPTSALMRPKPLVDKPPVPPDALVRWPDLPFHYQNGSRGRHDLPEIMGGGVALLDVDGDGRLDVYLCNGGPIDSASKEPDAPCRLYRNLGDGRFEDVTDRANAPGPSYAMGAAAADYDGDGRVDLLVTGWRDQRLYRNVGGRFEDVTERAGLASRLWSTSAAWADLDADGDLDLVVATYLDYDPADAPFCAAPDGKRDYCGPEEFSPQPDRLYRNNGDGTFTEISKSAGVDAPDGRGLGVLVADLVGSPLPDVFVANDGSACRLFENLGRLRFRDVASEAGVAFDGQGNALAAMGVALGDVDGDQRLDLLVGNLHGRSTVAFLERGRGRYIDGSASLGLTRATRAVTGFGLALVDLEADGALDLVQANGHVVDRARLGTPLAMPTTFLRGRAGRLSDALIPLPEDLYTPRLGRGLAVGDLDNDGRPDVVLTSLDQPPLLLRNNVRSRPVVIELSGRRGPAFGARVRARAGGREVVASLVGGGSYLSASQPRLFLGLGDVPRIDRLEVTWPDGASESWNDLPVSPMVKVEQGTGRRAEPAR